MKIAYLILAYDNPRHLERLVRAVVSPNAFVYLHIDRKSDLSKFNLELDPRVKVIEERLPVYWGDISGIQAILLLMKTAIANSFDPDYLFLLSGSDYPLQSTSYIEEYLEKNSGKEFMNLVKIPNEAAGKPLTRFTAYNFSPTTPFIISWMYKALVKVGIIPRHRNYRKYLGEMEPYGGSTWWCLSKTACDYILEFEESHPKYTDYFEHTFIPEEMFFHTILGNSRFKEQMAGNLVYTDWSKGGAHPAQIGTEHLVIFSQQKIIIMDVYGEREVLFARKFSDGSGEIVTKIEQMREHKIV